MKESIANSYVFSIMIVFIGIIVVILVGSLSYSKTFKIKNKIIDIIEKNKEYNNTNVRSEIEAFLTSVGYKNSPYYSINCNDENKKRGETNINQLSNHHYCVYRYDTVKGPYYSITVYINFDIPVIESLIRFRLSGETRVLYEL